MNKIILDACCGSRMFWFDKKNPDVLFVDKRSEDITACDGRRVEVRPDLVADYRELPFQNNSFKLVVFDPPHDMYAGRKSFTYQKYGSLDKDNWRTDLKKGYNVNVLL